MSEFVAILALYYVCDSAAATNTLSHAEVMECMTHYDAVKSYFAAPDSTASSPQTAYLDFKQWERANPRIVAELRSRL